MHRTNPNSEFATFIATLREELVSMPDEVVLEGTDIKQLRARRTRILEAARKEAGRRRMAAARAQLASREQPEAPEFDVDPAEARRYIAKVTNDPHYTLAARQLGEEMSDDEAVRLYRQLRILERDAGLPNDDR